MGREINTDQYLADVIEYSYALINKEFNSVMTALAASNPDRFKHVYEPGKTGIEQYKLWNMKLYGRGRKREASFEWIPSVMPILTPRQRAMDPNDPMSKVPNEVIEKLSDRRYVFRMQAPIMEYRMKVAITPVNSDFLFIPTMNSRRHRTSGGSYETRNYRFEKYNMPDWDYRNPQDPSGSESTVGQFTSAWVAFWNGGGAEQVWDSEIAPGIEKGLATGAGSQINNAAKMVRRRSASIEFSTFNDNYAAFESGANLARAFIRGKARSYRQAAKWIDKNGFFGGEREY